MVNKMNGRIPFLLKPAAKDYLWGGCRLNDDYGKKIDMSPLAETWECSTHPDGQSYINSGFYKGCSLGEVLKIHPDWLGYHPLCLTNGKPELPILIKLIDAKADLSVQVHPDDAYAMKYENESFGKAELWYVLDAEKGASLICGFNQNMDKDKIRREIETGTIERFLNRVLVNKNDIFYINPGMVHAIGAGVVIAEIQESSNLTYRLYDYDRVDKNGKKRELHIDKALDVAILSSSIDPRQPMRVLKYKKGFASEIIKKCKYFQVDRLLINADNHENVNEYTTSSNSFHAMLCTEGYGELSGDDFTLELCKGECIFIPADSVKMNLHGRVEILDISC